MVRPANGPICGATLGLDWIDEGTNNQQRTWPPGVTGSACQAFSPRGKWERIDKLDHCIVTIPPLPQGCKAPAIIVYGGMHGCEGAWFLKPTPAVVTDKWDRILKDKSGNPIVMDAPDKGIPEFMLERVYFILPRHFGEEGEGEYWHSEMQCEMRGVDYDKYWECLHEFWGVVERKGVSSYSLCGFSAGAHRVYDYVEAEPWKFIGLIDPVAPMDLRVLANVKECVRGVYNLAWYTKGREALTKHLPRAQMRDKAPNGHLDMPSLFFQEFRAELVT